MNLTEAQYERIARRLDGQDNLALDAHEQAALDLIRADEAAVTSLLDVPGRQAAGCLDAAARMAEIGVHESALGRLLDAQVPQDAIDRAWRRTQAALARPQRRLFRLAGAAGAVAAAAALLIATFAAHQPPAPRPHAPAPGLALAPIDRGDDAEAYVESVQATRDPAISLLAAEIDQLEADVVASNVPAFVDMGIDQAERDIEDFWLEDLLVE